MTLNIPEYYTEVSLKLNGALDKIGLRDDIRWKRINMWIQSEEALSLGSSYSVHYFGSQAEATTTPDLQSDIDQVYCLSFTAIQDLENWMPHNISVLVVSDESTPSGYIKLQPIHLDLSVPMYGVTNSIVNIDRYGRSVINNDHNLKLENCERNGSAYTHYSPAYQPLDAVMAVKLYAWPDQASHWLTMNRRHNWPSQETIVLIKQTGALLVPVGHKLSQEQHLEWRVSISYGEKLLMWLLNSTQYKCYILLKVINKSFIKPVVGDDALNSYHLKTCMFYIIENTPAFIWQLDNLLLCVDMCLRLLYIRIESKICPNYFIPEENMFQCKTYGHVPGQLLSVLSNLLKHEGRYLLRISCDNIEEKLERACATPLTGLELQGENVPQVLLTSATNLIYDLEYAVYNTVRKDWNFEPRLLNRLFFYPEPRQDMSSILCKFVCSFIGSKLASESLSKDIPNKHALDIANELLLWGSSSDVTSGKLKLAAFYLVQESFNISEDVLNEIHENYSYKVFDQNRIHQHRIQSILSENLSTTQLINQYVAFPVYYHPSEINCTHKALIPEMFRSTGSDQVNSDENYLLKLVNVDPRLYLYFLEFQCHHYQNKRSHKKAALDNVIYIILHENLRFKDSALNLLAYCLKQEGSLVNSYTILCKSMKLTKQHNAAKWQIATTINVAFNLQHGRK
ncbi:hypothetical protein CHS0354_011247 [Potamilus streckersoni]|uniref:Mab-21-like HhH/H2TH-like domain-containing protein n=1 Tax=Potamilus streckersoni TaxID=2493646 RepID=A0AAE0VF89_9BIVA|nr:hypothetical protein CHS0354_011247 [Potamilus streckersoni]